MNKANRRIFSGKITRSQFLKGFLGSLSAITILAACNSDNETLLIATEPSFPPFQYQKIDGELEGFDVDLIKKIAETAGLKIKIQSLPFDGIIPALQANRIDAAISAITVTPERAKTVSFSRPYFRAGLAIAVRENNNDITSLDNLQNKKIAAQIGTTGAQKAKTIPGAVVRMFDSAPICLQELANGNVDAVINDAPGTLYAINLKKLKGIKIVGELLTEEFYSIATPKNSQHLETINDALGKLIDNGTYAVLYRKWFQGEPPQLPQTVSVSIVK